MIRLSINKEAISKLPTAAFNGKIFVADTKELVDVAIDELRKYDMIGIDTETRPSFKKGVYHNVALLRQMLLDQAQQNRLFRQSCKPARRRVDNENRPIA